MNITTSTSRLTATTSSSNSLHATGQFAVTNDYTGTAENGQANWNLFSSLGCTFQTDQPFVFTLAVTNFHTADVGVNGYDSFVGIQDQYGADVAAFGESTTWGYGALTSLASGAVAGVLPAGSYSVRGMAAEGGNSGMVSHGANRLTSFTLDLCPPVTLSLQLTKGAVDLFWPASATNYSPRSIGTGGTGTWEPVTNAPVQVGDDRHVIVSTATGNRFFKLQR